MYAIEHNTVSTQVGSTVKNEGRHRHRPAPHEAVTAVDRRFGVQKTTNFTASMARHIARPTQQISQSPRR
jgi:hypothetical protein